MMSEEGGDDSSPRPKRKIKRVLVLSSSSDSDSDESVGVAGTRRKRLRVISDGESSDSSGSSIICSAVARRRTLPKLRDSEAESDSSGWMSDGAKLTAGGAPGKPASGFASDSSEGNSDKCSICLLRFKDQQVGTPETCEHIFCLDCIMEWSKNVNTCPVDRIIFNKIIVKACAGGRVLRTEEVKVVERSPSIEILVTEDLTVCEICGNSDNEETMLLCDGCDLGYHMQCLTPPLTEVPADQWLCSSCTTSLDPDSLMNVIELSEVEDLLNDIDYRDSPNGPRPSVWRQPRNIRRSSRTVNRDQPSTSSGSQSYNVNINELSTTSRRTGSTRRLTATTIRRKTTNKRRKYKRRKTKTVIIEYEVQENGKFPITKRVKRKVRRRRVKKRQPRTAARRSHVRASVRAKLASLKGDVAAGTSISVGMCEVGVVRRPRAVLPALRLFGNPNELDYFTDEDTPVSEEASTAVAVAARPTSNILSAYRQARRKMVTIPSPPHASSAPDILSNILESQTLLHSKQSIISISVNGNVDYKLTTPNTNVQRKKKPAPLEKKDDKVDLSKVQETVRSVPSYGGQGRGGGGWGGGYRGNYHRDQGAFRGGYQAHRAPQQGGAAGGAGARDHGDHYDHYPRRQHHYPADDNYYERRRPSHPYAGHQRAVPGGGGQSWQPPVLRNDVPPAQSRHSFGGFENPVDMRMGQMRPHAAGPRYDAHPPQIYRPMSEPPVFNFQKTDIDKSEDEKSDSGLIIDTEKYDPMEPTNDDSGDDEEAPSASPSAPVSTDAPPSPPLSEVPAQPSPPPALHPLLAGIDAGAMNVPPNILDTAVRQVLKEHRNLLSSPVVESRNERSDDDSDGDCPNFSIYSATSVHIANNTSTLTDDIPKQLPQDNLEDLVQEDDETPPSTSPIVHDIANVDRSDSCKPPAKQHHTSTYEINEKKKTEEEYKEKVSKRCPITTNTRNPIKIKLNTPSLIKRQVSLYDEEDKSPEEADYEKTEPSPEVNDEKWNCNVTSPKCDSGKTADRYDAKVKSAATDVPPEVVQSEHMSQNKHHMNEKNTETQDNIFIEALSIVIVNKEKENVEKGPEDNEDNVREFIDNNFVKDTAEEDLSDLNEDSHDHADIDTPETDMALDIPSPKNDPDSVRTEDNVEKMTESISETEDERSYTPCLDENRSVKDASFDVDKDKGLEGLGTEMISEEEGNEMFSENERPPSEASRVSPPRALPSEDGEIADKKKEGKKSAVREDSKKKKKKDSKKDGKEKSKNKKKGEVSFKKLSKSGKERNYRERDKDEKKSERERRDSGDDSRNRRRKEKRKDLERYDVRTVVTEKRRKQKDPFGRDVSPRGRSPSLSPPLRSPSRRRSHSPPRRRSPSPARRRSPSPARRRSLSRHRSPSPSRRRSLSRRRSPSVRRRSLSRRRSPSLRRSDTPRASPRRRSPARRKRRRSTSRASRAPRRRSVSASPPRRLAKKKKRARRALRSPAAAPAPAPRPPSPRTPPPTPPPDPALDATLVRLIDEEVQRRERRRREPERRIARRTRDAAAPSKEVFTSGDNILVSVSFKEQERGEDVDRRRRRETRREKRRRRRAVPPEAEVAKPVAIIDLERSPFRELTPSPKHVIVLSDSDHGERPAAQTAPAAALPEPAPPAAGPKTPPSPIAVEIDAPPAALAPAPPAAAAAAAAAATLSPDAYDPFEPTRSPSPLASPPSASPPPCASVEPPRALLTLEAAQRSNLSADDVIDRRPLTPVEKVLALLASCEEVEGAEEAAEVEGPAAPPAAVVPRIVLPSPTRAPPKLFPGKPSPIKSNPVKPMQALRLPRASAPGSEGASPYSPGSSDFGELFEPPPRRARPAAPAAVRKRGSKTQVGVKQDDDNLKILDDLPSSAVEMQVKSKFLKKLNRQERVVEEVKLVLKPHYNKKHVTKEEYKDILRRAVPKICHNKSGEINPTKIQALVEAYVKKFRKKHKLSVA